MARSGTQGRIARPAAEKLKRESASLISPAGILAFISLIGVCVCLVWCLVITYRLGEFKLQADEVVNYLASEVGELKANQKMTISAVNAISLESFDIRLLKGFYEAGGDLSGLTGRGQNGSNLSSQATSRSGQGVGSA